MDAKVILNQGLAKLKDLQTRKNRPRFQLGVEITPTSLAVAQIEFTRHPKPILKFSQTFYEESLHEREEKLKEYIELHAHKKAKVNIVLHPNQYRLLLVDSPEVPDEELLDAMQWRVKELINEQIENVVIDVIKLPKDAYSGRMNMVYVAVVSRHIVEPYMQLAENVGVKLNAIEIPETAMINLINYYSQDEAIGFLNIKDHGGFINVTSDGDLYLTRNIDISIATLHELANKSEGHAEQVISEVERSLEYYDSQLGKGGVSKLVVAPAASRGLEACLNLLDRELDVSVVGLDVMELVSSASDLSLPEQAHCLSSIGGAMRQ